MCGSGMGLVPAAGAVEAAVLAGEEVLSSFTGTC